MSLTGKSSCRSTGDHSLAFRGLLVIRVLKDVAWFSPLPMVGYAIFFLWTLTPLAHCRDCAWGWRLLAGGTFAVIIYLIHFSSLYWQLLAVLGYAPPWSDAFFRQLTLEYGATWIVCLGGLAALLLWRRRLFWGIVLATAAAYLVVFAVGAGNFYLQHYLFAIPAYVAVLIVFMEELVSGGRDSLRRVLCSVAVGVLVLIPFWHPPLNYAKAMQLALQRRDDLKQNRLLSVQLDDLLDRCHWTGYLPTGGISFALAKHSPLDWPWVAERAFGTDINQFMRQRFFKRLSAASIVFVPSASPELEDADLSNYLQAYFTQTPPACARGTTFGNAIAVYYRR